MENIDFYFKDNDPLHLCINVDDIVVDKEDDSVTYTVIPSERKCNNNNLLKNFYRYIDSLNR